MNHQSQDTDLLELAEATEDALRQVHDLVTRLSLYALERRYVRQVERNGIESWRAQHTLKELDAERKRLDRKTV